jgi:hypothetical protein
MSRNLGPRFKTFPKFQKDNFNDENLETVQSNLESFSSSLSFFPILRGRLINDIELEAINTNAIEHKLGRVPRGYFITTINGPASIYTWNMDKSYLTLSSTLAVKLDLWVF